MINRVETFNYLHLVVAFEYAYVGWKVMLLELRGGGRLGEVVTGLGLIRWQPCWWALPVSYKWIPLAGKWVVDLWRELGSFP